jgi:hypothetical protein
MAVSYKSVRGCFAPTWFVLWLEIGIGFTEAQVRFPGASQFLRWESRHPASLFETRMKLCDARWKDETVR